VSLWLNEFLEVRMSLCINLEVSKIFFVRLLTAVLILISFSCESGEKSQQSDMWISLFNGKDLKDWKIKFTGYELNDNYKNTFRVEDGILKISYDQYEKFNGEFGHIFYKDKFSHYKIRVEYRFVGDQITDGPGWAYRNNGIMLHCQSPESMSLDQEFPVSVEVQLLGGNGVDERSTGNVCTPGTHIVMDGELITEHCINSTSKTFHGDQWVTAEVVVNGGTVIKNSINGELVFELSNPQYDPEHPDAMKLIKNENLNLNEGYISLQAETHPTEFRKIEILNLK
jgi:hypothetical protein